MLIQISENSVAVTPYGSLGNVYQTVGSVGRGQRDTAAGVPVIMRTLTVAVIGTLMALVFACSASRADWASNTFQDNTADADESDLDALAISEQDDASLIVTCVGKSPAIVFHEPRANWHRGEAMEVLITSDAGDYRQLSLNGNVTGRTVVAVSGKNVALADADALPTYTDETAAIVLMGQAQKLISISVGGYTRSFPASNFHDAVEPVLRRCGLAWFGNDVKQATDSTR